MAANGGWNVGVLAGLLLVLASLGGCGGGAQTPADVTRGVWVGDGGADQFVFDLRGSAPDSLFGVVHVLSAGKLISEVPITRGFYAAPNLEMYIPSTNATYKGRVDGGKGRVRGGLSFGGQPGAEMELRRADPEDLPGLEARSDRGTYTYVQPMASGDGWEVASPEDVGLERSALEALVNGVAQGEGGLIHALLVVRGGRLVLEEYFHGFAADDLHRLASVTKSVSALLVGAALDRGMISGLDAPLLSFFPTQGQGAAPGWSDESLHHLMSMTMGLDWTPQELEGVHGTGPDFFREVLARSVVEAPGTRWRYASANVNLLAGVLHQATGMHADAFAREALFTPLGIRSFDWEFGKVDGYCLMDGSLRLKPRDVARIGTLVAQGGRWAGTQVIGQRWIHEITRSHNQTGQPLSGYGDLWWLGELPGGAQVEPMVVANGWGSQFIVIFPRLDMVVVTTGGNEDNGRHLDVGNVIARYLLSTMSERR